MAMVRGGNMRVWANRAVAYLARALPSPVFVRLHVLAKLGYWPRLASPRRFAEHLQAKNLLERTPLVTETTDKYLLRGYVERTLGEGYLPDFLQVVDSVKDLDFASLPTRYAMKATHASGWNLLVEDSATSQAEARSLATLWLKRSYYWQRKEWGYKHLKPRVMFEEYLEEDGRPPADYKFFTFNGVPRLIQVDVDRYREHRRVFFDENWRPLSVRREKPLPEAMPPPPRQLNQMKDIAGRLASPFSFARVDLYALGNRVLVGEITHYPGSGVERFDPRDFDTELGEVWSQGRPVAERYLLESSGLTSAGRTSPQ